MRLPVVVIVGRPNVGKSSLFNRLFGRKRALVHDIAGVTRDRLEETIAWDIGPKNYELKIIDTGGLGGDRFAIEIEQQVKTALTEADVVLCVFDRQVGLTHADRQVVEGLMRGGLKNKKIPLIGVVNKVDDSKHEDDINDFYELGLEETVTISAEHNRGIDDLKKLIIQSLLAQDKISEQTPEPELEVDTEEFEEEDYVDDRIPHIAIVGRPNVGKSTLTNAFLNEDRMITSPIAGTTIDSIDSLCEMGGRKFVLIDTAGIRRKSKTEQGVEVLSVVQTKKALDRCDLAVLVLDGEEGISDQDEKIGGMIEDTGCAVMILMNKWDMHKNTGFKAEDAAERIRKKMAFLRYAPILFVSAKEHTGLEDFSEIAFDILEQRKLRISTKELTEWVKTESAIHNPMNAKFYLTHQSGKFPPTFICHVSDPQKVHFSLQRHFINAMRERWGFMGSPIRMKFLKGRNASEAGLPRK